MELKKKLEKEKSAVKAKEQKEVKNKAAKKTEEEKEKERDGKDGKKAKGLQNQVSPQKLQIECFIMLIYIMRSSIKLHTASY